MKRIDTGYVGEIIAEQQEVWLYLGLLFAVVVGCIVAYVVIYLAVSHAIKRTSRHADDVFDKR